MPNLPSVSYMVGQFQEAISVRKALKGDKFFIQLEYLIFGTGLDAIRVTILVRTIHDREQHFCFLPGFTSVDREGRSTSHFHL